MKILVADDDAITRATLSKLLEQRGYEVVTAADGDEAYRMLNRPDAPPLAILDWMMPGRDGIELCRSLRAPGRTSYTYVLMLSGRREKEDFIAGLDAGADEYVAKPFDIDKLHARVRAAQRIVDLQDELQRRANQDALTGLFNRGAIMGVLQRDLAQAARETKPLSVVLADLDHFKAINDNHGHPVGDSMLRAVGGTLAAAVRAYDAVGRYGGEEFLLVLPGCRIENAREVAERVRAAVARASVETESGPLATTVSLGVAGTEGGTYSADEIVSAADRALYRAKHGGRNRVEASEA